MPVYVPDDGGDGVSAPTRDILWTEESSVEDKLSPIFALQDDAQVADFIRLRRFNLDEDAAIDDAFRVPVLRTRRDEDATVNDRAQFRMNNVAYGRGAVPDADPGGDIKTMQLNPSQNFGAVATLNVQAPVLGANEQRAYLMFDLTWAAELTAIAGVGLNRVFVVISHNVVTLNQNLPYVFSSHAARPFTESVATWDAPPPAGTTVKSGTVAVASGGGSAVEFVFTESEVNALVGKWMMLRFVDTSATAPLFSIRSREDAVPSLRPFLQLSLKRS